MNPLLVLDQLDDRMQQSAGGRRDAQRFAPPYDQAVQMIDLTALAARPAIFFTGAMLPRQLRRVSPLWFRVTAA
jgi:hypothetical protein